MANLLERADDGSVALFINGDLQFDSNDEHIYHESLTLPALSILRTRNQSALKALVIGGGDGLVARDLFKTDAIDTVDLVDYDPQILSFAKTELANINNNSLSDPRLTVHVRDAWDFVDEAIAKHLTFDLIIIDLTVAEDINGARFHSLDWYKKLAALLVADGVLAVNAVSPLTTPEAYWSIFNSILKGGLQPRAYHVHIPSFAQLGFGQTWGRFIAANQPIMLEDLGEKTDQLKDLFVFPQEIFAYQSLSLPAIAGSDILLHYFANASVPDTSSGLQLSSFSLDLRSLIIPEADTGKKILPPELRVALAKSIDSQTLLQDVLELMPSLQRTHTPAIIADFLDDPGHFLEAIDLPALVKTLLQRAMELPAQVVAELELLAQKLSDWAGDHMSLLSMGRRVITILTLVIVVGNLLYPDTVYGKGEAGHAAAGRGAGHGAGHAVGHGARGGRGGYGYGWNGGGTTYWNNYNRRPINNKTVNVIQKPAAAQTKNYGAGRNRPQGIRTPQQPSTTGMNTEINPDLTLISYLSAVVRDAQSIENRMQSEKNNLTAYNETLKAELNAYELTNKNIVSYGSHQLPKAEAIRRTQLALKRTINKIDSLSKQIEDLPIHIDLAQIALNNLNQGDNA